MNKQVEVDTHHYLMNHDLPHLSSLINHLNEKSYSQIKDQKKLIASLIKLYNMVGMKSIKESIAKQTSYLISKMEQGNFSMKMLNCCLFGSPGVGKTKTATIMAEIWHNLGFLQHAVEKKDATQSYFSK